MGQSQGGQLGSRTFSERRRSSILVGQRSVDLLMEQPGEPMPRFVIGVIRCYRRWGYFVADNDWKAMALCLLTSLIGLFFVVTTPQLNDITGYSPFGARAREEYTRYQEFFSKDGPAVSIYIFALAKDGGSMLREEYLRETVEVLNSANENVTLKDSKGVERNFSGFCVSFCKLNEPVRAFYQGFKLQSDQHRQGLPLNNRISLDYPIAQFLGRTVTLQQSFFGIEYFNDSSKPIVERDSQFNLTAALLTAQNDTLVDEEGPPSPDGIDGNGTELAVTDGHPTRITNMREVKMVVLQFRAEHQVGWTSELIKTYEKAMVDRFEREYMSDNLKLYVLTTWHVEDEMVRAGISLLPYLTVGFLVMMVCAICSVLIRALYMHQHSPPKIFLAIAACFLPFMSCATALGFMFIFGMRFASILCLIPFLVLSIGVDSSYLMIHEWQRVIKHCREQPNRKNCNVGYRISQVLVEVGPAILISTLTNIFADGMGAFTSSPEIMRLCLGNMVSMMIAFVYQMTFYAGLMSLVGRYEIASEKRERREMQESIRKAMAAPGVGAAPATNGISGKHPALTRQQSKFHEHTKHYISESTMLFVNVMANRAVALLTIGVYFLYLFFSIWGISRIQINLSTQKLFRHDSPLLELDKLRVQYQVPHFTMATVFVNRPGNLSDPARLRQMNNFVAEMERLNGSWGRSWGPVGTQYFVRDFINFELSQDGDAEPSEEAELAELEGTEPAAADGVLMSADGSSTEILPANANTPDGPFHEEDLGPFLRWPEWPHWKGFVKLNNQSGRLERFFFTTGYHGDELSVWTERGDLLKQWRAVVDKYSVEFDASVFHEDAIFLDLIDNMPTDTLQSVLGTLVCMALVCFLFLNSFFTVIMASSCVLSICCGILGILSWWGIDLDPITMAAMIISIGFSVDIPAHVSYHYYQASVRELDATPQMKLVNCLSSVAFPALQAALSTTFCVCSLLFVQLYMAEVFVKTMVLCVALCNLHGLVFLPAFLIVFDSLVQSSRRRFQQSRGKTAAQKQGSRPSVIPEEGSQESSLRDSADRKLQNGLMAGKRRPPTGKVEQSTVTDRPKLERFHSIDLEEGKDGGQQTTSANPSPKKQQPPAKAAEEASGAANKA